MRRTIVFLVLLGAKMASAAHVGEYLEAARAMSEWRFDEARAAVTRLESSAGGATETRFLAAEVAFLFGDYVKARQLLEKLDDARVRDLASEMVPLVTATEAVTHGYVVRESPHFVFRYPPGKDEVLIDWAASALEAAHREVGSDLGVFPAGKVRVEIYPRVADLARVSTLTEKEIETTGTIALCKYNKLMIVTPRATIFGYPWMDTLVHEYTHYLVSVATHDRAPVWLQEGLAKLEETRWRKRAGEWSLGWAATNLLSQAVKRGRLIAFEEMHPSMAKLPSQEAGATAFAEVLVMASWIEKQAGHSGIRAILGKIKDGVSERRAIAEVLGMKWTEVVRAWEKHVRSVVVGRGMAKRRFRVLRFRKEGGREDDEIGLEEVAAEKARSFARLGGLLRTRGRYRAAAMEYEKALAITGADEPFIAAKLARTYLAAGEAEKAIQAALPVAEKDEDDAELASTLGVAYLQLGKPDKAEEQLILALRVSPFDPAVRCALAEVYRKTARRELAEREAASCLALKD